MREHDRDPSAESVENWIAETEAMRPARFDMEGLNHRDGKSVSPGKAADISPNGRGVMAVAEVVSRASWGVQDIVGGLLPTMTLNPVVRALMIIGVVAGSVLIGNATGVEASMPSVVAEEDLDRAASELDIGLSGPSVGRVSQEQDWLVGGQYPPDLPPLELSDELLEQMVRERSPATMKPTDGQPLDECVLVTRAAAERAGGVEVMNAWLVKAVTDENRAFFVSGGGHADIMVRLLPPEMTSYVPPVRPDGSLDFVSALTDMFWGRVPGLGEIREELGCDQVALIVYDMNAFNWCGMASQMNDPSRYFVDVGVGVVDVRCVPAGFIAHEFGHSRGLQHRKANAGVHPVTPYAYGYSWFADDVNRLTIMCNGHGIREAEWSSTKPGAHGSPDADNYRAMAEVTLDVVRAGGDFVVSNSIYVTIDPESLKELGSSGSKKAVKLSGEVMTPESNMSVSVDGGATWRQVAVSGNSWSVKTPVPDMGELWFRVNGYDFRYEPKPVFDFSAFLPLVVR